MKNKLSGEDLAIMCNFTYLCTQKASRAVSFDGGLTNRA